MHCIIMKESFLHLKYLQDTLTHNFLFFVLLVINITVAREDAMIDNLNNYAEIT